MIYFMCGIYTERRPPSCASNPFLPPSACFDFPGRQSSQFLKLRMIPATRQCLPTEGTRVESLQVVRLQRKKFNPQHLKLDIGLRTLQPISKLSRVRSP